MTTAPPVGQARGRAPPSAGWPSAGWTMRRAFDRGPLARARGEVHLLAVEAWQAVLVVLAGVLAGALVPAAVVLVLALLEIRAATARTERVLAAMATTAERIDRLGARLEKGGSLERLTEGLESLSRLVVRLEDGARVATAVGAAVGPAVGAAVRAWRSAPGEDGPSGTGRNGSGSDRMGEAT